MNTTPPPVRNLSVQGSAMMGILISAALAGFAAYSLNQSLNEQKINATTKTLLRGRDLVAQKFERIFGQGLDAAHPGNFTQALAIHHSCVDVGDHNAALGHCIYNEGTSPAGDCTMGAWIPFRLFGTISSAETGMAIATPLPLPTPPSVVNLGAPLPGLSIIAGESSGKNRVRVFYDQNGERCENAKASNQCPLEATADFCASASFENRPDGECPPASPSSVDVAGRIFFRIQVEIAAEEVKSFKPLKPALILGSFLPSEILNALP